MILLLSVKGVDSFHCSFTNLINPGLGVLAMSLET